MAFLNVGRLCGSVFRLLPMPSNAAAWRAEALIFASKFLVTAGVFASAVCIRFLPRGSLTGYVTLLCFAIYPSVAIQVWSVTVATVPALLAMFVTTTGTFPAIGYGLPILYPLNAVACGLHVRLPFRFAPGRVGLFLCNKV